MIEPAEEIARRLKKTARAKKLAERYWAGWKLSLTFGPHEDALPKRDLEAARLVTEQIFGPADSPRSPEIAARLREIEKDLWHLSVSWRGSYPAEEGKTLLAELVIALGVPTADREGKQPARVFQPDGRPSPQVTHWLWRDAS